MSQKSMAVYLTVSEIERQKWTGGSFYPPLAGIRVKSPLPLASDKSSLVPITLIYLGLPIPPTEVASREEFTTVQRIQTSVYLRQREFVLHRKTIKLAVVNTKAHTAILLPDHDYVRAPRRSLGSITSWSSIC